MNKSKTVNKFIFRNYIPILISITTILILLSSKSELMYNLIGYRSYVVTSQSMMPRISTGDVVLVKNINTTTIKQEDIITFYEDNEVVTHRIKQVLDDGYITKGDNNTSYDSVVFKDNIIGKVILIIPKLGNIFIFLSNPYIICIELISLGILLIFNKKI